MKLNKTCSNLVNFGSCFIVHSLGMGLLLYIDETASVWVRMGQFSNSEAAHSRTIEAEVTPGKSSRSQRKRKGRNYASTKSSLLK